MLKKASNFVLSRASPCDVPLRVRVSRRTPCDLAREGARLGAPGVGGCDRGPFEHPVTESIIIRLANRQRVLFR
jgi:hypothetical protein